jgi:Mg2+-importing ATPase
MRGRGRPWWKAHGQQHNFPAGIMAIGGYLPSSPLASFLGFVPLPPLYWVLLLITLVSYVGLTQLVKVWLLKKSWI